jgi:hypothetical protein
MPKSKTKNRKRAKMLRQRKKQREARQNNEVIGKSVLEKRLKQNYKDIDIQFRDKNPEVKISDLVINLVAPLMDEALSFDEEKNVAGLGVAAWNLGIIRALKGEKEMLKSLEENHIKLPNDVKKLLLEYAEKKYIEYPEYNQFIYDYEFKYISKKQNHLTVAYQITEEE